MDEQRWINIRAGINGFIDKHGIVVEWPNMAEQQVNAIFAAYEEVNTECEEQDAELRRLQAERDELRAALESLTPGGSEFSNSPERCVEFVRARLATLGRVAAERNELRAALEAVAETARDWSSIENTVGDVLHINKRVQEIAQRALRAGQQAESGGGER